MNRKTTFFSALLSVGAGAVLINISRLISVVIATRYLSVNEMGLYFLVMISISVISAFASFGTNISLVKFINEKETDSMKNKTLFTGLNAYILSLILTLALSLIINYFWPIIQIRSWYIFLFLTFSIFNHMNVVFQGLKQFRLISISNSTNALSKFIFVVLFLMVLKKGFSGLLMALVFSNFLALIFQMYALYSRHSFKEVLGFDTSILKEILVFSGPIYLNQLYSILYSKGYSFLLAFMLNPSAVAYFNIATRIPNGIEQLRQIYLTVFFPTILDLIKNKFGKAMDLLHVSITAAMVGVMAVSAIFFPFREEIMAVIFSEKFVACSLAAFLMLFRCIFTSCNPIMGQTLIALGKNKAPLYINFLVTTVSFPMTYFLIPSMGYMAAVYVSLAASVSGFFLNWLYLKKSGMAIGIWLHFFILIIVFIVYIGSVLHKNIFLMSASSAVLASVILIFAFQLIKMAGFKPYNSEGIF